MAERLRRNAEGGQDLVEHALVLPFLMLLVLGIVEFSLAIWHYDTVANVAREVARCGIIYNNTVPPNSIDLCITDAINKYGIGVNLDKDANFLVDPGWDGGDAIRVQVDWQYQPVLGLILNAFYPIHL